MGLYDSMSVSAITKTRSVPKSGWYDEGRLDSREAAAALLDTFFDQMIGNGPDGYVGNGYAFQAGPGGASAHRVVAGLFTANRNLDPELADAALSSLRLFAGCPGEEAYETLSEGIDLDAATGDLDLFARRARISPFIDGVLDRLSTDADLSRLATDLDRSTLPSLTMIDPDAPPRYPDITVKVEGLSPLLTIEKVQKAILKAGLGETEAYRFRAEAASGRELVEDVVRRWVSMDVTAHEPDGDGPGMRRLP